MRGRFKWYNNNRGYGFILCDDEEYFVHRSSLPGKRLDIEEGQPCEFEKSVSPKGLVALNVKLIHENEQHPALRDRLVELGYR